MITLASLDWGTGPKIPIVFAYEHQRSGADMQYRAKVTINPITSTSGHFGYPIYLKLTIGGTLRETTTLKAASPDRWTSAITYTSPWYTVAGKTSGTTVVSFNIYSGSGSTRNETYSYSMAVDPAASLLAAPNGTLGTALTLTVTKYNTAFTHTITYKCGNATGTVITTGSAASVSWGTSNGNTVALAAQNTAGKSVTVTFTIITYSGGTEVGRNTASCLMAIPNTVKPSVALSVADAAGLLATYGAYVQGKSKLTITANPTLAYGSPIKVYEITADGKTYSTSPVTTGVLQGTGTLAITAKVTDNRTYPSDVTKTNITVLPYSPPAITVTAYRCNSSGAADQEGAYMKFGFTAEISSLNSKNSATYSIGYKAGSGAATKVTGSGLSYTSAVIACDVAQNWTIEVTVTDKLSSTVKAAVVPIAFTLMDFYATGKGVAFGKVATRDGFDCAMPAYFTGATELPSGLTVGGKTLLNLIYPIGSIYMSVSSTSPASFLGGTWERLKDRFLLAAGDTYNAGATGGASVHLLTQDEMPFHTHAHYHVLFNGTTHTSGTKYGFGHQSNVGTSYAGSANTATDFYNGTAGGNMPHNNMPPYLAVYMWKRTA